MKKDNQTNTNHEQSPVSSSTHLIILLFGLIVLLFAPGKLSFGGSKQQSFATEKRLFLDLSQKKLLSQI